MQLIPIPFGTECVLHLVSSNCYILLNSGSSSSSSTRSFCGQHCLQCEVMFLNSIALMLLLKSHTAQFSQWASSAESNGWRPGDYGYSKLHLYLVELFYNSAVTIFVFNIDKKITVLPLLHVLSKHYSAPECYPYQAEKTLLNIKNPIL